MQATRNQKINILIGDQIDSQQLIKDLHAAGFQQAATFTKDQSLELADRELIVFANTTSADIIAIGEKYGKKPRYFFYNTKGERWEDERVKMTSFASNSDTLAHRLTETLEN